MCQEGSGRSPIARDAALAWPVFLIMLQRTHAGVQREGSVSRFSMHHHGVYLLP